MDPMEEGEPLTADDQRYFDAIRQACGGPDCCTEDFCIRLARAFRRITSPERRMEFTVTEAKRILAWRVQLAVDRMLITQLDQTKEFNDCWPGFIYGEDKDGHLVSVIRISEIQIERLQREFQQDVSRLVPHRVQYMERIQWEKAAISKRLGRRVYKHIVVIDLQAVGMKHLAPSVISQLKPIFDLGQLYYPETLYRLYLINVPMILW